MCRQVMLFLALIFVAGSGCASGPGNAVGARDDTREASFFDKVADATEPMRRSWNRITETKKEVAVTHWDWASGIPAGVPRSELFAATLPAQAVAHFLPNFRTPRIQLASTHNQPLPFQIKNVGGMRVQNCGDLHRAIEHTIDSGTDVQIDFIHVGAPPGAPESAVMVDPPTLVALAHTVASDQPTMRIAENGSPWLLIRDGGVRGKLTVRTERERGVLQLALSFVNCWGDPRLLPTEIRASCNGQPLRCLTAAETLDVLYGQADTDQIPDNGEMAYLFSAVSERDDFLIPTNYNQLYEKTVENVRPTSAPRARPALASLPGMSYPGPPILGDARALTGFLLQRELCCPGDREKTGWIMFAGNELCDGGIVDVSLDLGSGLTAYRFLIPSE